nr:hypothetical protein [Faecalicatena contorta]
MIIGRTSSGKSSITKEVCKRLGVAAVKSYTTRPMREDDKVIDDHIFITDDEVDQYKNDMAAYTEIDGYKYFTTFDILNKSDIYIIDPVGADNLKIKCKDKYQFIEIYIRTPAKIAEARAKARGQNMRAFKARWIDENVQFTEYENRHTFQYHLRNDRPFEESVEKVCKWIQYELSKDGDEYES